MPVGVDQPILAPVTSIMGEIMLVGITSDSTTAMDLRTIADAASSTISLFLRLICINLSSITIPVHFKLF